MRNILLAASLFAASTPAFAQSAFDAEIVITAGPEYVQHQARVFANRISAPTTDGQMPRWSGSICPGMVGMRADTAQAVIDRMAQTAFSIGLDVGEPGCTPNLLIFFSRNADETARQIASTRAASAHNEAGLSRGRDALREFAESTRPVRWWHVAQVNTADGFQVEQGETARIRSVGRLGANVRQDLDQVFIVIDADRVSGVQIAALADYVAMAALGQIDPNANVSDLPTILALFDGPSNGRAETLTRWDLAYLTSLYAVDAESVSEQDYERDIAREMRDQLTSR